MRPVCIRIPLGITLASAFCAVNIFLSLRRTLFRFDWVSGPSARACARALTVLALGATPAVALANAAGVAGYSGKTGATCSACHSGGNAQMELSGPATLAPTQAGTYTLKITAAGGTTGMGIAASDGVRIVPVANARPLGNELGQAGPIAPTGGSATYTFQLIAPASPGSVTIWACGMVANADGREGGDAMATKSLQVAVMTPSGSPPDAGDARPPDAGPTTPPDDDDDAPDAGLRDDDPADSTGNLDSGTQTPPASTERPDAAGVRSRGDTSGTISATGCSAMSLSDARAPATAALALLPLLVRRRPSRARAARSHR